MALVVSYYRVHLDKVRSDAHDVIVWSRLIVWRLLLRERVCRE